MSQLPSGTVTFLFTDIEGSTRLLAHLKDRYGDVLADHQRLLRTAFAEHAGQEIDTQGDSFFVAFHRASDAVAAAVSAQLALAAHTWPDDVDVRVRMGLHTGEPSMGSERYVGLGVHRAARICAGAHGGQVLLSGVTRGLVEDDLPAGVGLRDLGEHDLKDLDRPEHLSQLVIEGLPAEFPPPRTAGIHTAIEVEGRERELEEAAEAALAAEQAPRARRRRRWAVAAVAGAIVVGTGAAVAVITLRDGSSSSRTTSSGNAVAVIDPEGSVDDYLDVGSKPSNIAIGNGAVWVLDADDLTVSKIDPKTNDVTRTFGTEAIPTDLAVGEDALWIGNGEAGSGSEAGGTIYTRSISRIDPRTNLTTHTTRLPGNPGAAYTSANALRIPGVPQLAAEKNSVWAINPDGTVSRIDPTTGEIVGTVRGMTGVSAIAAGREGVWLLSDGRTLARVDPRSNAVTQKIEITSSGLIGIAVGAGSVWATAPFDGTVWRVDPGVEPVTRTIPAQVGVTDIAFGDDQVWTSNFADGTVSRINIRTNSIDQTIPVEATPQALASGEGAAWVSVNRSSVASCTYFYEGSGEPDLVIASDLPLRGPAAGETKQMEEAIGLVLADRGYRAGAFTIGYRSCDDSTAQGGASDFFKCVANAHAYADDPTVVGVVGTYRSGCALLQLPIMNSAEPGPVTMVSPANTYPGLTHQAPGIPREDTYPTGIPSFARVIPADDYQGAAAAVLANALELRSVYVLRAAGSSPEFGLPLIASFSRAAGRLGVRVAGRGVWDPEARSYATLAEQIDRSGAQGVFIADINLNGGRLIEHLRVRLDKRTPIIAANFFLPLPDLLQTTGTAALGMYITWSGLANELLPREGRSFVRRFSRQWDGSVSSFASAYAGQAADVLLDAIARSDGTRSSVNEEVRGTSIRNGILGTFRFNTDGDIVPAGFTIFRVVGGNAKSSTNVPDLDGSVVDRAVYVPDALLRR